MSVRNAEYPRPKHFLVHLSDTHLVAQGELYDAVDASTRLREVLSGIVASGARPDALIFTGDLTDQGHPDAYAELKAIVGPVAERKITRLNSSPSCAYRSPLSA